MNQQKYVHLYHQFHGSVTYNSGNCIVLADLPSIQLGVLMLQKFSNVSAKSKPMIQALKYLLNISGQHSVFTNDRGNWVLLLKNHVIYPVHSLTTTAANNNNDDDNNQVYVFNTDYFLHEKYVRELKFAMEPVYKTSYPNIYFNHEQVVFLDEYDIPYSGGTYFNGKNLKNKWYRLKYMTRSPRRQYSEIAIPSIFVEMKQRTKCMPMYYPLLQVKPVSLEFKHGLMDQKFYRGTQPILPKLNNILDVAAGNGVLLQYPMCCGENAVHHQDHDDGDDNGSGNVIFLAVNCSNPKRVFFVPKPHTRYYEYDVATHNDSVPWIPILYDGNLDFQQFQAVVWDRWIIGYTDTNVFLCLGKPKYVPKNYAGPRFRNLEYLFKECNDVSRIVILHYFMLDNDRILMNVKHESLPYEFWCLTRNVSIPLKKKVFALPAWVTQWSKLLSLPKIYTLELEYNNNIVKILYTFIKHDLCFQLHEVSKGTEESIRVDGGGRIIFCVHNDTLQYINKIRIASNNLELYDNVNCSVM